MAEKGQQKWRVSGEAFHSLLAALDPDPDAAAARYERIRLRLIKYFAWERCPYPEEHADEVFDRVARRVSEGERLSNPEGYFHGVARVLVREIGADLTRRSQLLEEFGAVAAALSVPAGDRAEAEARCFQTCLDQLPAESRSLILRYYQGDARSRIAGRKALAEQLGIPLNALRNRALRLRARIESCVRNCVEKQKTP